MSFENYIQDIKYGDICALYDTYYYKNNNLCFKSLSRNNDSIYEIKIYSDGKIFLNLKGENKATKFNLILSNLNKLEINE